MFSLWGHKTNTVLAIQVKFQRLYPPKVGDVVYNSDKIDSERKSWRFVTHRDDVAKTYRISIFYRKPTIHGCVIYVCSVREHSASTPGNWKLRSVHQILSLWATRGRASPKPGEIWKVSGGKGILLKTRPSSAVAARTWNGQNVMCCASSVRLKLIKWLRIARDVI